MKTRNRCAWVKLDNPLYVKYHDEEWGVPCFDDAKLFEMLLLESAQAGLSWETILKKRANYRKAFDDFAPLKIATYKEDKITELLANSGIVRNRLKILSAIRNAQVFLKIQEEFGSFSEYIWAFVGGKPIQNNFAEHSQIPTQTALSDAISKDLKKRGMNFVGSTIIYAYIQAIGMVNDHEIGCFCRGKCGIK